MTCFENFVNCWNTETNHVVGNQQRSLDLAGGLFEERSTAIPQGSRAKRLEAQDGSQRGDFYRRFDDMVSPMPKGIAV